MRQGVHMGRGRLKSGEAADYLHISYQTLRKYILNNEIEYTRTPGGQTSFKQKQLDQFLQNKLGHEPAHQQHQQLAFYLRDSQGNQERINRQKQKLEQAYGQPIQTYQDKASGLNENRKGLQRLLNDAQQGKINTIAITAKDRLTRFGYKYLERLLTDYHCKILILDDKQDETAHEELIQDFLSLLASFSGKYYKLRGLKHEKMMLQLAEENSTNNKPKKEATTRNHEKTTSRS